MTEALAKHKVSLSPLVESRCVAGPYLVGPVCTAKIVIGDIVEIDPGNGSIRRLAGFTTTDEAALKFWDAVARIAPRPMEQQERRL